MINRLIEFSLKNRFLILIGYVLLAAWGYWALLKTPIDAIPDLSENQVIVFTDWPGRSPQGSCGVRGELVVLRDERTVGGIGGTHVRVSSPGSGVKVRAGRRAPGRRDGRLPAAEARAADGNGHRPRAPVKERRLWLRDQGRRVTGRSPAPPRFVGSRRPLDGGRSKS